MVHTSEKLALTSFSFSHSVSPSFCWMWMFLHSPRRWTSVFDRNYIWFLHVFRVSRQFIFDFLEQHNESSFICWLQMIMNLKRSTLSDQMISTSPGMLMELVGKKRPCCNVGLLAATGISENYCNCFEYKSHLRKDDLTFSLYSQVALLKWLWWLQISLSAT